MRYGFRKPAQVHAWGAAYCLHACRNALKYISMNIYIKVYNQACNTSCYPRGDKSQIISFPHMQERRWQSVFTYILLSISLEEERSSGGGFTAITSLYIVHTIKPKGWRSIPLDSNVGNIRNILYNVICCKFVCNALGRALPCISLLRINPHCTRFYRLSVIHTWYWSTSGYFRFFVNCTGYDGNKY